MQRRQKPNSIISMSDPKSDPLQSGCHRLNCGRSLGQNFVTDEDILERIAHATGIQPGEPVLEFGPGERAQSSISCRAQSQEPEI